MTAKVRVGMMHRGHRCDAEVCPSPVKSQLQPKGYGVLIPGRQFGTQKHILHSRIGFIGHILLKRGPRKMRNDRDFSSAPQITSKEHFDDVVSRAAGADEHEGYEDAQGNWRVPHKLMMVQVHAGWCRVCKGLQPKLLKLIAKHPEVLCCKINKTHNEASIQHPNRQSRRIGEVVL